jgi:hypothetical protein
VSRGSKDQILVESGLFTARNYYYYYYCYYYYWNILFFGRAYYLHTGSIHVKFVVHNLKISHRRHVCYYSLVINRICVHIQGRGWPKDIGKMYIRK